MTRNEIERYLQELIEIKNLPDSGNRNKGFIELSKKVGASGCGKDMPTGERDAEHIASIHYALQTATMIDMCKTANRNFLVALTAMVIAILSAVAAICSAIAAWIALSVE